MTTSKEIQRAINKHSRDGSDGSDVESLFSVAAVAAVARDHFIRLAPRFQIQPKHDPFDLPVCRSMVKSAP